MIQLGKVSVTLGFIPLTDCAPLVIAKERGFFAERGVDVTLSKETSWANIRDKVAIGVLDGAHMLAPMPIAATAGLGPVAKPMVTALSLGLNGNAITVSNRLHRQLQEIDAVAMAERPATARALKQAVEQRRAHGHPSLTFATVFPFSTHSYQLRYWLAAAGVDPDRDVRLVVVPPPQMVNSLARGDVDGYCVGEPWNGMAVHAGVGRALITSYELWNNGPEKVFGVTAEWAEQNPATHHALVTALLEAARWMDQPSNRLAAVELLARSVYVNAPPEVVAMSMTGTFQYARDEAPCPLGDFNVFHRYAANFPWRSHAVWLATQMARWGQLPAATDFRALAGAVYRPDLYRLAAAELGIAAPTVDEKSEGQHAAGWRLDGIDMGADRFFDGGVFDPRRPDEYLNRFSRPQTAARLRLVRWTKEVGT